MGRGRCRSQTGSPVPGTRCCFSLSPAWSGPLGPDPWWAGLARGWAGVGTAVPALCSWYFSGISRTQAQQLLLSPTQRAGGLPCPAQREQPRGLLTVRYRVPLTLGWLPPSQCQPPTHLGPDSMHHLVGVAGGSGQAAAKMWPPSLCPPSLGPDQSPPLPHLQSSQWQPLPAEGPARPQPGGAAGLLQGPLEADPEPMATALCAPGGPMPTPLPGCPS